MTHHDSQRREIREGQLVAYNLSGDVVPGRVIDAATTRVKILHCGKPTGGVGRQHVSKVANGRSILILDPPESPTAFHWTR